jgi:hypothetical protein
MLNEIIKQIKLFFSNAILLQNKTLLFIIISLFVGPFVFFNQLKDYFVNNINLALRFTMTYVLSVYQLIVIYNESIIPINNPNINIIEENRNQVGPADVLRRIADQIGIDLNNLIDIEIIQIEQFPLFNNNEENNNDAQNVHDTSIQSHILNCINRLKEDKYVAKMSLSTNELINEIKKYIFNEYKGAEDKKEKAIISLNKMKKINGQISKLNMTEIDILKLVWNRINNPINAANITNLKDNLVLELADSMIDDDNVYCVQGRASRIIQSLECSDAENIINLKPIWIIKEEIGTLFGKYRNKIYEKLNDTQKTIYNKTSNISKYEEKVINNINNIMYNKINEILRKKYLDTQIINEQQYLKITQPYFDAL